MQISQDTNLKFTNSSQLRVNLFSNSAVNVTVNARYVQALRATRHTRDDRLPYNEITGARRNSVPVCCRVAMLSKWNTRCVASRRGRKELPLGYSTMTHVSRRAEPVATFRRRLLAARSGLTSMWSADVRGLSYISSMLLSNDNSANQP